MLNLDKPHESCAVFGVFARGEDVAVLTFFALFTLQHRGQESSGMAVSRGEDIFAYKEMGLVSQIFTPEILKTLQGHIAIGHNRYSTTGSSKIGNAQPIVMKTNIGKIALAHNGNLVNYKQLKDELEKDGLELESNSDSEVIAKLFAIAPGDEIEKLKYVGAKCAGAYSVTMLTKDKLIGFRDPWGVRPLCLGKIKNDFGESWVLSSESCALNTIGAEYVRELEAGEAVVISDGGLKSFRIAEKEKPSCCIFEYIYFARPDSVFQGRTVYNTRFEMGKNLAVEHPCDGADAVLAIPDSSLPASIGYSRRSGIEYAEGLIKNRYIARTFIQPQDKMRQLGVKLKFNPVIENIKGKSLVIVDDSIVRGNTTKKIVKLLKDFGARQVHVRITSPPMTHPCFLGVDTATYEELIAAKCAVPEIAKHIGADSLGYLSLEGLLNAIGLPYDCFCAACFTGDREQMTEGSREGRGVLQYAPTI